MITVKKDAIRYKTSEGMQYSGVLCNVGVVRNPYEYLASLSFAFAEVVFPDGHHFEVSVPIFSKTGVTACLQRTFYNTVGLKSFKLKGNDDGKSLTANYMFQNSKDIEVIDFSEFKAIFSNVVGCFMSCSKLKTVLGIIDLENSTNNVNFVIGCSSLENIRFKENSIKLAINFANVPLLSEASIQSIIDGLATVETSQTLSFHADVKAKLTEQQIATITSKNWTLA